jgi:5-(carboxyamino)imidazole ribonucleotide mutase
MAGMAAHLPGVVASLTTKPVLGVPLKGGILDGLDALLSVVQMPKGVPVGCLAVGSAGARNAAHLAAQILSLSDESLAAQLRAKKEAMAEGRG